MRKDEKPRKDEKTKRRHAKRRQIKSFKWRLFAWRFFVFSRWNFVFSRGGFRLFVFSPGVISSFRLFAWRFFVFSSFRMASFRLFVFSRGVFSRRKDEKTKWHKPANFWFHALLNLICSGVFIAVCYIRTEYIATQFFYESKEFEKIIARTLSIIQQGTLSTKYIFNTDIIFSDLFAEKLPFDLSL